MIKLLHSNIQPYIADVLAYKFGVEKLPAEIVDVTSSLPIQDACAPKYNDRVTLKFPFAGSGIQWTICFDLNNLNKPPDFLSEDKFFDEAEIVPKMLPSLGSWGRNYKLSECLLQLILELIHVYKVRQVTILKNLRDLRVFLFQYETLFPTIGEDVGEILIETVGRESWVTFCIALDLDVRKPLPAPTHGVPAAVIYVTFRTQGATTVRLSVLTELENLIGHLQPPHFDSNDSLINYVPEVKNRLENKVRKFNYVLHCKKCIINSLYELMDGSILDVDSSFYSKISFLLENNENDHVICVVDIPNEFPERIPELSYFKITNNESVKNTVPEYKFKSGWHHNKIASFILEAFNSAAFKYVQPSFFSGSHMN